MMENSRADCFQDRFFTSPNFIESPLSSVLVEALQLKKFRLGKKTLATSSSLFVARISSISTPILWLSDKPIKAQDDECETLNVVLVLPPSRAYHFALHRTQSHEEGRQLPWQAAPANWRVPSQSAIGLAGGETG
ncbi:MAG TPA: hypothetical protein VEK34_08425 [Methylocella sp.]|nr:hypothetical protein [Methylocella sp.]